MKFLVPLIPFILLSGCGTITTLEELEAEALVTGDWTQVERREDKLKYEAAMVAKSADCDDKGTVMVCEERFRRGRYDLRHCYCGGEWLLFDIFGY